MTAEKKESWLGPWCGLFHCGKCLALITTVECPVCGHEHFTQPCKVIGANGVEREVPTHVVEGALSYTAVNLLALMEREWERPILDDEFQRSFVEGCSQRVLVVLLFWTLFEHVMDQFFRTALSRLPVGVAAELMQRHQSIGSRMGRLYTMMFATKLKDDLTMLGYGDVHTHLQTVQTRRNDFVHGKAAAIDDALVRETVERLKDVQAAWVALFNLRCTGNPLAPKVYEDRHYRACATAQGAKP